MKITVAMFMNSDNGEPQYIMDLKTFRSDKRTKTDIEDNAIGYLYDFNVAMGHKYFEDGSFVVDNGKPYAMINDII